MFVADLIDQSVIGNPDTFPENIHLARLLTVNRFVWTSAGKERAVDDSHHRSAHQIGDGDREKQAVLVVDIIEVHTVIRHEDCQPHPLPVKQIIRNCQRDAWASGGICRVGHHILLQGLDVR